MQQLWHLRQLRRISGNRHRAFHTPTFSPIHSPNQFPTRTKKLLDDNGLSTPLLPRLEERTISSSNRVTSDRSRSDKAANTTLSQSRTPKENHSSPRPPHARPPRHNDLLRLHQCARLAIPRLQHRHRRTPRHNHRLALLPAHLGAPALLAIRPGVASPDVADMFYEFYGGIVWGGHVLPA